MPKSSRLACRLTLALLAVCLGPAAAQKDQADAERGPVAEIVINEVFADGDATADWVEIANLGTGSQDISTWWICARFSYDMISNLTLLDGADLDLAPGEIVTVATGFDLNAVSSDFGIYTTNDFGDDADMVDFVQWGTSADVGRSDVARDASLWREFQMDVYDFTPTPGAGESIAFCGTSFGSGSASGSTFSSDLASGATTRGAANGLACPVFADGFQSGDTAFWLVTFP